MGYQATSHSLDLINTIQLEVLSDIDDIKRVILLMCDQSEQLKRVTLYCADRINMNGV
ncbi:hypothetical protein GCM10025767_16690 [Thalassotalea piscium]|uniref:Uncharacterized protein n=1 Tax=Thalassotalea piscium TaxID=1230533 RepID=A0A7X0NHB3_9GAMM|nr:hypothetical protein [Thalassotalea piscium]